ncbi:MAG: hypothetical protein ABSA12_07595 [Verrucomicrobiia bacterium]|jgi:hypothetical protein
MKIPSEDVIQADSPRREMQTIEAVARGAKTDDDIAGAIGGLTDRQGRYYRRAGEALGFLRRDAQNESVLTPLGREYAVASAAGKRDLMTRALLANPLVQRLIPFLESKGRTGATRGELERFLASVSEFGGESMAHRRASSYVHWLREFGLADDSNGNLVLKGLPEGVPIVHYISNDEPLLPRRYILREYQERAQRLREASGTVTTLIDQAKRERALSSHTALVNLVAQRLKTLRAIPKDNDYIDLAARVGDTNFLFEMKSTTEDNARSQIRRGLSQLYEYRYLQQIEQPKLVLVIENPLPRPLAWIETYLRTDRNILLVWDGNNRLYCSDEVRRELPFLQ